MHHALLSLEEFIDLCAECGEYETERLDEFLLWRFIHPALGQIVGVQGVESARILTLVEKQLCQQTS